MWLLPFVALVFFALLLLALLAFDAFPFAALLLLVVVVVVVVVVELLVFELDVPPVLPVLALSVVVAQPAQNVANAKMIERAKVLRIEFPPIPVG